MRFFTLILVPHLVGLVLCSAQATPRTRTNEDGSEPRSESPYEIARIVHRASRSWKEEHIETKVDLSSTWKRLGIDAGDFEDCTYCEARLFRSDLDGKPGREAILKLTKSGDSCRYLIFRPGLVKRDWKLIGYIDHDFNRYQMAHHRIVRAFGRNWFVLYGQEGSGSGYYLYGETWFAVTRAGIRPILNYVVDGHTDPVMGGLKWELSARAVPSKSGADRRIRLLFEVRNLAHGFGESHFAKQFIVRRHADYAWDRKAGVFKTDPRSSTISEAEMNAVANTGEDPSEEGGGTAIGQSTFFSSLKGFVGNGFEVFLRLNMRPLTTIAAGPDTPAREWLREFLGQCNDIPEKLRLEKAMQK